MTDPRLPYIEDPVDYALTLERELEEIDKLLARLLFARLEGKSIDTICQEIEEWMDDDWWLELSEADRARFWAAGY